MPKVAEEYENDQEEGLDEEEIQSMRSKLTSSSVNNLYREIYTASTEQDKANLPERRR